VSSGQPSSSQPEQLDPTAYQVSGVNSEGFDGVVHLLVAWQPSDNGTPYADSWERFYGISDETMLYGRFEKWGSYPVEGSPTQDALDVAAGNPCYELLEQGILPLLEDVAGEWISHTAIRDVYTSEELFVRMAFQILTSVPIPVLQGICGAGLQRRKALDLDMYAWLTNNLRKSESRPTIYMIELTDDIGRPLKYEDMRKLIKGVRVYIDEKVTAKEDFAQRWAQSVHWVDNLINSVHW
jgi:hypothetical protein